MDPSYNGLTPLADASGHTRCSVYPVVKHHLANPTQLDRLVWEHSHGTLVSEQVLVCIPFFHPPPLESLAYYCTRFGNMLGGGVARLVRSSWSSLLPL